LPDIQLAEKKTVLQILESFKGTAPLRELLAQLNYDPLNEPVSRKEWPEPAQVALAQDPRLYGRAAGEFYVVYAQLAADKLKLTDERTVIPHLLKHYPYALFVFSDKSQSNFHFVNVKWENNQKRRLYRRITVGPQERMRTAAERLSMLDIQTIDAGLFGVTAQHIQDRHDEAFDVAKVSKSFFDEYKRVFEVMRDAVKGFGTSDEEQDRRHLFTQRLFNRLMFLRFIQKKEWLTIDGSTDYLAALWASHGKLKQDGKNFYTDRLRLLFAALNNERVGIVLQGGGGAVEATIGKVKYLNGGLFEETDEDKDPKVRIADESFKQIFDKSSGLFEAFNFTITESTPLDIEIAVDPEMLGKIFEELVTGRHDSGSYYTPKPVVSFMCREALKGYLETHLPDEARLAIERFVDRHEPDDIRNAEAVLNALRRVTVCDPACGSGAYLLGMMHELLDLRQCLFQTRQVDNRTMYQRKLDIIQTNIYGVDVAEFAVNIARLRLWLSLSVDFDGPAPEPLPNLDYKIETGDSIGSPSPGTLQLGIQQQLVAQFVELKRQYFLAHHEMKPNLRSQVEVLQTEIRLFSGREQVQFDWVINFAEVFIDGGFDVVIANPPYISAMDFSRNYSTEYRKQVTDLFRSTRGSYDFYIPFFERGIELLRSTGDLTFITPNKYLSIKYGVAFREYCLANTELIGIVDLSSVGVFESASVYPVITSLRPKRGERLYDVVVRTPANQGDENPESYHKASFSKSVLTILPENIWGFLLSENLPLLQKMLDRSVALNSLGIVGATSTAAEADAFGEFISAKPKKHSKKIINTGTIDPFRSLWGVRPMTNAGDRVLTPYLDVTGAGVSKRRREMYDSPKVIFAKMARRCEAFYDPNGEYASVNTNCFYSPLNDPEDLPMVAAYCGSKAFMFLYHQLFGALRMSGGYFQFQAPQLRVMPMRIPTSTQRAALIALAVRLSDESNDASQFEVAQRELEDVMAEIYEFTPDERQIVESY
jgi:hypothetical protein